MVSFFMLFLENCCKGSKIPNIFLILLAIEMFDFRVGSHKMFAFIPNREDPDRLLFYWLFVYEF